MKEEKIIPCVCEEVVRRVTSDIEYDWFSEVVVKTHKKLNEQLIMAYYPYKSTFSLIMCTDDLTELPINYCPFCGRKLNGNN